MTATRGSEDKEIHRARNNAEKHDENEDQRTGCADLGNSLIEEGGEAMIAEVRCFAVGFAKEILDSVRGIGFVD